MLSVSISTLGAEMQQLTMADGRQLQWAGDPRVWSGRAPILFPVIGPLQGGHYNFGGMRFAMPKHGFARTSQFDVIVQSATATTLRLGASDETRAIYPFEFCLDIVFALEGATLSITALLENLGEIDMPASFGFHPALRWPLPFGQARDANRITFAHDEPGPIRRIDRDGFLTPQHHRTPVVDRTLALRDDLFVDDALIFDYLASRAVVYGAEAGPKLGMRFADFPTLGVWTKPGADFICIEPWHGFADPVGFVGDIRDKPGIFELAPGARRKFEMSIELIHDETGPQDVQ